MSVIAIGFLPIGDLLIPPLEEKFSPRSLPKVVDGLVVLGGVKDPGATAYWGQPELNEAAERLTAAVAIAHRHPEMPLDW